MRVVILPDYHYIGANFAAAKNGALSSTIRKFTLLVTAGNNLPKPMIRTPAGFIRGM